MEKKVFIVLILVVAVAWGLFCGLDAKSSGSSEANHSANEKLSKNAMFLGKTSANVLTNFATKGDENGMSGSSLRFGELVSLKSGRFGHVRGFCTPSVC